MASQPAAPDILCISPFERPDVELVRAAWRAGALGVLDLGRDPAAAARALAEANRRRIGELAVRVSDAMTSVRELPASVVAVVLAPRVDPAPWRARVRRIFAQVTSVAQAREAIARGADALVAKGSESGGVVGEETAFVLLQALVAAELGAPIWVQGGVGLHTAAACFAGGAAGVVLDVQLALAKESSIGGELRRAIASFDGSETVVEGGVRVLSRPGLEGLPAGQDVAFARLLAERHVTVGGIVGAVRAAARRNLELAREHAPLAPRSPLAAAHGSVYPIVQGPMTRVSDRAGFAEAVARAGGLPFVALSLLRGRELEALLDETRARLGDRPWGVGVLGFVPEAVRSEQLAAVLCAKPPLAIIAGGRPAQARPLEKAGIATYLHVPSPGLLDLFLADGARRFVFEGRECGGHVGPRTSFVLWETQIERLLAFDRPEELCVLFAGGIHDARSAAMVAAASAPLIARGARMGVLMGTAYLFTEEAVTTGAIGRAFQEAALACRATALLETAPGHATRCADTPFVEAFRAEKRRLEASGTTGERLWEALERYNLGRLRLASKGLVRSGESLVPVDETTQRAEGLFMIGQAAALRSTTCTMEELHRDVSEGATALLAAATEAHEEHADVADVAIVGMACIFPGAEDLSTFWSNVVEGVDAVGTVPEARWSVEGYFDPNSSCPDKTPSKWGGFLPPVVFDPATFGIPPRSLAAIDPVQLLSLEVARRALEDAGYATRPFDRSRTSVVFGAEAGTDLSAAYGFRALWQKVVGAPMPPEIAGRLPVPTEDSFPGVLSNVIAGRIANRLDLRGSNFTVDAACAASLAAVDLAVKELRSGAADMVLCGGADLHNGIHDYLMFASVHALSPTGRCRTFDRSADGIVLGEGVACLVLKRLADAERDGDRIYAVISGVGASSDGKSLGLTAPRKEGQRLALERAYARAGISPAEIGLVEAHGTGTVVGDRTELACLTEVFAEAGAHPQSVALGSVKSQIGHTKCAAGMAGLIKAALAVHRGVLPPTLHVQKPNEAYDASTSPFVIASAARPWVGASRKAAVSAFGFGGTNYHAVLRRHDETDPELPGVDRWPSELFLLRGETRDAALAIAERLERAARAVSGVRLVDLAATASRLGHGRVQIAIVASDLADFAAKIAAARAGRDEAGVFVARTDLAPGGGAPKTAFLFPGQGSQRPGMLCDLFIAFPAAREKLSLGPSYVARMIPPPARTPEERAAQAAALTDTTVAQPALGMAGLAMAAVLRDLGVRPDVVGGHSYGELVALVVAGALRDRDLTRLSEARARAILDAAGADPGAMLAVSAGPDALGAIEPGVVVANENAPDQTVLAGPSAAIERAAARLESAGLAPKRLAVACAFHSPIVAGAARMLARALDDVVVSSPALPVFANATAEPYPDDPAMIRELVASQVARPVLFARQIEAMYAAGVRIFVEAGPGRVLTGLVRRILGDRPHAAIACDESGTRGVTRLLTAVAELAALGVVVDPTALFEGRGAKTIDLDEAAPRLSPTAVLVDGTGVRPIGAPERERASTSSPTLPPPTVRLPSIPPLSVPPPALSTSNGATRVAPSPSALPSASVAPASAPAVAEPRSAPLPTQADATGAVLSFLATTREMVQATRAVMLGYLGAPLAAAHASDASRAVHLPFEAASAHHQALLPPPPDAREKEAPSIEARSPSIAETLLALVSERTGYPPDMLDPDLDLEADLGVDSIKRIEILGALRTKLGLAALSTAERDESIEQLSRLKTMRAIVTLLEERLAAPVGSAPPSEPAPAASAMEPPASVPPPSQAPAEPARYTMRVEPASSPRATGLAGRRVVIAGGGDGVATRIVRMLEESGARPSLEPNIAARADAFLDLGLLGLGVSPRPAPSRAAAELFERTRGAVLAGVPRIVAATELGRRFVGDDPPPLAGAGGILKSIARERPGIATTVVHLDPADGPERLAEQLVVELCARPAEPEVAYAAGVRSQLRVVESRLEPNGRTHARLDRNSVVLLTGGARGITAHVALALAREVGCKLEIVGRSRRPDAALPAELARATDLPALRAALLGRSDDAARSPRELEAECRRILSAREIEANLDGIAALGAEVRYHAVDVRDRERFGALVDDVYARHGRIDGVIHGAGVIEDRRIEDKTAESFLRVFETKVLGALTLAQRLRPDVSFVVFFSSVASVFGNRGQADYAAANDALDRIAAWMRPRVAGRVVSINWGPWSGTGMVSSELERMYEQNGVGLISPEAGARCLLDELFYGDPNDSQVIWMRADPERLSERPPPPAADE